MNDVSSREPSPQESLKAFESDLRRKLGAANAPPFIGLLDVGPEDRERIRQLVREKIAGDFRRVSWAFNATPAVAAWSVAGALTEDYGGQDAAIYRIVEDVLGVSLQLPVRRDKLYVAFSDVCRRFELALFRGGRKVDAYLVQAGVSRPQLPDVIEAFLRAERAFGPPPTHATDALNSWEDEAFEFLPQGLRVPRRVLEADDTGFHAAAFARCRSGAIPQTDFERRFQSVLEEIRSRAPSAKRRQKTVARPKLVWSDGALALSVPRLEGRLRIDFNGQQRRLREGIDWPIPQPWPRRIGWAFDDASGVIEILDSESHALAFDAPSGRLLKEIGDAQNAFEIDAPEALLIARSPFSIAGADAVGIGPESFVAATLLGAAPVVMQLDGRRVKLTSRPRPRIRVEASEIAATGRGGDLLTRRAAVLVDNGRNIAERRTVSVAVGDRQSRREIELDGAGRGRMPLDEFLGANGEPVKIRAALLPPEIGGAETDARAVASITAWIWPDLETVETSENGVLLRTLKRPASIAWDRCRHVTQCGSFLCLDSKGGYAHARIAFDTFDTQQGAVDFDIPWPGISIMRISPDGETRPLAIGTRPIITETDRNASIAIASPNRKAALRVRGRYEPDAFRNGSRRVLSMRDLAADAPDDRVLLEAENEAPRLLLEISRAMEPERFDAVRRSGKLEIQIKLPIRIDALRFELESETGESQSAETALGRETIEGATPAWLDAALDDDNDVDAVTVRIDLSGFDDGVVFAHILARALNTDKFQPLRSGSGDIFALALTAPNPHSETETAPTPDSEEIRRRFLKLSQWMAVCLAGRSWDQVAEVLPDRWREVGSSLLGVPAGAAVLMEAGFAPPPPDSPPSWVPMHHPLSVSLELYGASAKVFSGLRECDAPGAVELACLADLSPDKIPVNKDLSPLLPFGFSNVRQASASGERLADFSIPRYFQVLAPSDTDPSSGHFWRGGELLGPAHWRAAHLRLRERLEEAGFDAEGHGNQNRILAMQRLIQCRRFGADTPAPKRTDAAGEELDDRMSLWCAGFFRHFTAACRERKVSAFLDTLSQDLERNRRELLYAIGFLLRLGPELFAFYMLLSELAREEPDGR